MADGVQVPGYNDEIGRSDNPSLTETFVAIRGEITNWRWGGVPFYLRTGKRLAGRGSEIVIQFREVPHDIFPASNKPLSPNRLIIRVQPDERIKLSLMTKVPGATGMRLRPAPLNLAWDWPPKTQLRWLREVVGAASVVIGLTAFAVALIYG